jgi:hypothetical protein
MIGAYLAADTALVTANTTAAAAAAAVQEATVAQADVLTAATQLNTLQQGDVPAP